MSQRLHHHLALNIIILSHSQHIVKLLTSPLKNTVTQLKPKKFSPALVSDVNDVMRSHSFRIWISSIQLIDQQIHNLTFKTLLANCNGMATTNIQLSKLA